MIKNFFLISAFFLISGCSSHLPLPKGEWQPINEVGFVPVNVKTYIEGKDVRVDTEGNRLDKNGNVYKTPTSWINAYRETQGK